MSLAGIAARRAVSARMSASIASRYFDGLGTGPKLPAWSYRLSLKSVVVKTVGPPVRICCVMNYLSTACWTLVASYQASGVGVVEGAVEVTIVGSDDADGVLQPPAIPPLEPHRRRKHYRDDHDHSARNQPPSIGREEPARAAHDGELLLTQVTLLFLGLGFYAGALATLSACLCCSTPLPFSRNRCLTLGQCLLLEQHLINCLSQTCQRRRVIRLAQAWVPSEGLGCGRNALVGTGALGTASGWDGTADRCGEPTVVLRASFWGRGHRAAMITPMKPRITPRRKPCNPRPLPFPMTAPRTPQRYAPSQDEQQQCRLIHGLRPRAPCCSACHPAPALVARKVAAWATDTGAFHQPVHRGQWNSYRCSSRLARVAAGGMKHGENRRPLAERPIGGQQAAEPHPAPDPDGKPCWLEL